MKNLILFLLALVLCFLFASPADAFFKRCRSGSQQSSQQSYAPQQTQAASFSNCANGQCADGTVCENGVCYVVSAPQAAQPQHSEVRFYQSSQPHSEVRCRAPQQAALPAPIVVRQYQPQAQFTSFSSAVQCAGGR